MPELRLEKWLFSPFSCPQLTAMHSRDRFRRLSKLPRAAHENLHWNVGTLAEWEQQERCENMTVGDCEWLKIVSFISKNIQCWLWHFPAVLTIFRANKVVSLALHSIEMVASRARSCQLNARSTQASSRSSLWLSVLNLQLTIFHVHKEHSL